LSEYLKKIDDLKDIGMDGNIILKYFKEIVCEIVDWVKLVQDRVQWRALENTVMDLRVPKETEFFD
jgi:hypothetical protein